MLHQPVCHFDRTGPPLRCNLCNLQNDIPAAFEYDETRGVPRNKFDRVELNHSVVEFVAPKEYMARALSQLFLCSLSTSLPMLSTQA